MQETKRMLLKKGDIIRLSRRSDEKNGEDCRIKAFIGEGGSALCYWADFEGKSGRLKEFYPADFSFGGTERFIFLKRTKTKQLTPVGADAGNRFKEMRDDFISAYETLEKVKRDNIKNEVLNNYIPAYLLLYGCPDEDTGTASVYVWTPDDKVGKGFDEYIAEVRKHPGKRPVQNLYNIISAVATLTDCITAFHSAGLLHLDIKPSNFLLPYKSTFEVNTAGISLFDINSIYPIAGRFPKISGTDGYRAPEVEKGKAENRSDIYSIGAMLFNAIIISEDIDNGLYKEEYYSQIDQLVKSSALMTAADANTNVFLQSTLSMMLKKCLARRVQDRYSCCEDLIDDLDKAKDYLLPSLIDTVIEEQGESSPTAIIQNLLYKNPIIDCVPEHSRKMNILVVGAGTYAQKFIDICLQVGQIPYYELSIKAVSNDPVRDCDVYLQFRPAINQFVNINESLKDSGKEIYATLVFEKPSKKDDRELKKENPAMNRRIIDDLMSNTAEDDAYQYVFIALGNDEFNHEIAKTFVDAANALEMKCSVNFVVQASEKKIYRKGNPVFISERVSPETISPDLEKMAFNAHLSWMDSLNVDIRKASQEFHEIYNYESSLSYALSVQYKLRSLGIKESDNYRAAELFSAAIADNADDKAKFRDMVAAEHRRWVVEKAVDGWTAPTDASGNIDYEGCIRRGSVKDKAKKLHPCIVRSTSDAPLSKGAYTGKNRAKWDAGTTDASLDDLDRMSLELHRCFKKHAKEIIKKYPLESGDMYIIGQIIKDAEDAVIIAYNRYKFCIKSVLSESRGYSEQYDYYKKAFEDTLDLIPKEQHRDVATRVRHISKDLFPVIESNLYRDYKANDESLVMKIPFILTYNIKPFIAMAFDDGRMQKGKKDKNVSNDFLFTNVASATVINPGKINYLYYFDGTVTVDFLIQRIHSVLHYLKSRKPYAKVHFSVAVLNTHTMTEKEKLFAEFNKLQVQKKLSSYYLMECENEDAAMEMLVQSISARKIDFFDCSTTLFASQKKKTMFTELVYRQFNYFEFNAESKTFMNCKGSEHLKYIEDKSFIRVDDMFALRNAVDDKYYLPEYSADYETLWSIYSGGYQKGSNNTDAYGFGIINWNRMCEQLKNYSEANDKIAEFKFDPLGKGNTLNYLQYFFPDYGHNAVESLIKSLSECGAVSAESTVSWYTSDTCKVDIFTRWDIEEAMEKLFSRTYYFAGNHFLRVENTVAEKSTLVSLYFDNLVVNNLHLEDDYTYSILEKLSKGSFITRLRRSETNKQVVSFAYSSQRLKKLLTKAGEILEIYVYYEALKAGHFDDVVSGYEFKWEYGGVKNELDCVLTKGFQSLIVECKGRKKLEQDFYYKLQSISEQFGIGCKKVLIANTFRPYENSNADNDMQKARGDQMGVYTVSEPDDIMNIGHTLRRIMEGKW